MKNLSDKNGLTHRRTGLGICGFTLLEIMVVSVCFCILVAGIYAVLDIGNLMTDTGFTYIELSQDTRLGVDQMIRELHCAQRGSISIPDGDDITFQVLGSAKTIQYSLGGTDGTQLIRTESGTATVLCNNVQSIQFSPSPFSGNTVLITLGVQKTSRLHRDFIATSSVNVTIRN